MFFIGVMGIDQKQKQVKSFEAIPCPNCKEEPRGRLIKTYSYFHVFFIPLFKWGEHYIILCDQCQQGFEVSKEKGRQIETGEAALTYWDMKPLQPLQRRCPDCGKVLASDDNYCPKCGRTL
ncbi:MAG: zinc ribbon domain-containing protein [Clostridia bacterium]|nr:zinc ribbon domain-containing protein [Clostridia bacterium]